MKKTRYIVALVAAMFAVGAILFVACKKDEVQSRNQINNYQKDTQKSAIDRNLVNQISQEVADFHNLEVMKLIADSVYQSLSGDSRMQYYLDKISDDAKGYCSPTLAISIENYCNELFANEYMGLNTFETDLLPAEEFTFETIMSVLANAFLESKTYDEFVNEYYASINVMLGHGCSDQDFVKIRVTSGVALGSFCLWVSYLYQNDSKRTFKEVFNNVKKKAAECVEEALPYAKADAKGAWDGVKFGATVGAIAGGEAAVGTIAAGAVIGSVHGSLKYAMNN